MDEFKNIMREAERESLQVNQALAKMLLDMWKNAKGEVRTCTKRARQMFVAAILAAVLAVAAIIGCLYLSAEVDRQGSELRDVHRILEDGVVIEQTTTETTTETITQDTGEGSGNNVYQAGAQSSYTQDGGGN